MAGSPTTPPGLTESGQSQRWHGRRSAGYGAAPHRSAGGHRPPASAWDTTGLRTAPSGRGCALARRPPARRNVPERGAHPNRRRGSAGFRRARDARVPHLWIAGAGLRARALRRVSCRASGRILLQGTGGVPELHRSSYGRAPWASPMLVVVFPSPAGVGVIAETSTSLGSPERRRGVARTAGSTLAISRP